MILQVFSLMAETTGMSMKSSKGKAMVEELFTETSKYLAKILTQNINNSGMIENYMYDEGCYVSC